MNNKFSHLRMKHKVGHVSTCTEPTCIYAPLKITDNFLTHLWLGVSNHRLDFSQGLKNRAGFVCVCLGFHKSPQEEMSRSRDLGDHSLLPYKDIARSGNFSRSNASVSLEVWQVDLSY